MIAMAVALKKWHYFLQECNKLSDLKIGIYALNDHKAKHIIFAKINYVRSTPPFPELYMPLLDLSPVAAHF
jgi:hypothetical protein